MEKERIEFRIYRINNSEEEHISTKGTMKEAHVYIGNSVNDSNEEMAHRNFFYRRYYIESDNPEWQLDESFGEMRVGAKTAKGLLEDLDSNKLND